MDAPSHRVDINVRPVDPDDIALPKPAACLFLGVELCLVAWIIGCLATWDMDELYTSGDAYTVFESNYVWVTLGSMLCTSVCIALALLLVLTKDLCCPTRHNRVVYYVLMWPGSIACLILSVGPLVCTVQFLKTCTSTLGCRSVHSRMLWTCMLPFFAVGVAFALLMLLACVCSFVCAIWGHYDLEEARAPYETVEEVAEAVHAVPAVPLPDIERRPTTPPLPDLALPPPMVQPASSTQMVQ
jgi:Na+-transporting methylmalonyl-CoA/oxaloacetate decarboxylase gamma subunit